MSQGGIFDFNSFNKDVASKSQELSKIYQEQLKQISKTAKENPSAKLENLESTKEEMPGFLKQTFGGEKETRPDRQTQQKIEAKPQAKTDAQQASAAKNPQALEAPKPPQAAKIPTPEEAARKFDQEVTRLLAQAKPPIPLTEENKELARMLLYFKAQVELKNTQRITSTLAHLPEAGKEEKQSACFLHANNLHLTKENVKKVSHYMKENSQIANKFAEIQDTAVQIAAKGLKPRWARMFAKLPGVLGKFIIHPSTHNIREMKIALFKLARAFGIEKDMNKVVFRQVSNDVKIKPDAKVSEEVYRQVDLDKLASALSSASDKFTGDAAEKALLVKVADLVSQLSQNLSGAKLINEAGISRANEGLPGFYCMNVPMRFGEELSNGKLIIGFAPYGINHENIKVDFRIETPQLGFMHFILNIVNNVIEGHVYVETDKVKNLVEENIIGFKKALLAQLYQISYIACDIIEEGKVRFLSEFSFDDLDVMTA